MTIELYVFPPSPRAFKAMVVANHLGLDWTMQVVDPRRGDLAKDAYAAMNPNMRMPTLKDGDYVLWEANAICQYLASLQPAAGLLPSDERGRLDVTRWQFWDLAHWEQGCVPFMLAQRCAVEPLRKCVQRSTVRGGIRTPALPAHLQQRKPRSGIAHRTRARRRETHAQLLQMRTLPRKPLGR